MAAWLKTIVIAVVPERSERRSTSTYSWITVAFRRLRASVTLRISRQMSVALTCQRHTAHEDNMWCDAS